MAYEREMKEATAAVTAASRLCRRVQASLATAGAVSKDDASPVTVADFGAQAVVAARLAEAFPGDPVVGEEQADLLRRNPSLARRVAEEVQRELPDLDEGAVLAAIDRGRATGEADRYWVLDPVDGTKGFLRGEQYAVALALVENGEVVAGVLGCPNLAVDPGADDGSRGCLFGAVRGGGAFQEGFDGGRRPIAVDDVDDPAAARFCESVEAGHSSHSDAARIAAVLGVTTEPLRMDAQCKYGVVGRGEASIYLRLPTRRSYVEKVWDHAAGSLVVCEAGGRVTDVEGRPLDFSRGRRLEGNRGVIATNGRLHDRVLGAVARVLDALTP